MSRTVCPQSKLLSCSFGEIIISPSDFPSEVIRGLSGCSSGFFA